MVTTGETVSHYRILDKLGGGGMGLVYRAHDERLDRDVALKVLPAGMLADESSRGRFRREALTLSQLNHPNIAVVYDLDSENGVDFLTMEYVLGETLTAKVAAGPLPEKEVISLGTQIAEALEDAHEHGIIHRDLKPGNVMVTAKGRVKVLDFGLAKMVRPREVDAATASLAETQAGVVMGTVPYMAPEQLQGKAVDARADVYALGAVLYEMATGRRPFPEKQSSLLIASILTEPAQPPRELNHEVSPGLEVIILKALEKGPDKRFQSAKELLGDLGRLSVPASVFGTLWRTAKRHRMLTVYVAAGLVLAVALLIGLNIAGLRDRFLGRTVAPRIESIAVLPLENMSGDKEQEYFADGMTEELIANLGKVSALKVISRTSVMHYKGTQKTVPEIARDLNVDAIIEGSVLRAGDRVRITAQLIQGSSDKHLWAESYDRDLRDVLGLQSEVARAITDEIKIKVTPQEQARLASARPVNPEAFQALLMAEHFANMWPQEEYKKSIEYIQRAIALDPSFARAHLALAGYYFQEQSRSAIPTKDVIPLARAAIAKALELDPELADAHAASANIKFWFDWDWSGAEQDLKRTLAINPNSIGAHGTYAALLNLTGRSDEAVKESLKARELDPLEQDDDWYFGLILYYARRYDESIAQLRKVAQRNPDIAVAPAVLSNVYVQKRMYPEAVETCRKAVGVSKDGIILGICGWVYGRVGRRQDALAILGQLKQFPPQHLDPYIVAYVYDGLGDSERTMHWLERAYRERSPQLPFVKIESWSDSLRAEPRFQDLLRRMNFPP